MTVGVGILHVLVMLGLLLAAGFMTFQYFITSFYGGFMPELLSVVVLLWIGFMLYFSVTEVLQQRVA